MAGQTACTLRDLFLNAAVRDEGVCLVREPFAETGGEESLGYGAAHGHGVTLTEGTGCVLDTALGVQLGVAGRGRAPLAELRELVGAIVAEERQHAVEHGRHVAGVEEETVASYPAAVVGIGHEELRVKYVDEVCASHGTAGMSRLGFFNHCGGESADVVGRTVDCS